MCDKGKKDKGKREQQKKAHLDPKEKRKLKKNVLLRIIVLPQTTPTTLEQPKTVIGAIDVRSAREPTSTATLC